MSEGHTIAPSKDEIEISLFGPGYGECSVIHYGDGNWIVIDSCLEEDKKTPVSVAYLKAIGVDYSTKVTHFMITHPDSDHIGGAAEAFNCFANATLVCSPAMTTLEMCAYAVAYGRLEPTPLARATTEYLQILKAIKSRKNVNPSIKYAIQDTVISEDSNVTISSLSPAANKIKKFTAKVAEQLPQPKDHKKRPTLLNHNEASAVFLIETQHGNLLFGADLEEESGKGWTTILSTSALYKKAAPSRVYKVAHHGSPNADTPDLWASLTKDVIAILAPFNRVKKSGQRPNPEDVKRILSYTDSAYSSSSYRELKVQKDYDVDKQLKLEGIKRIGKLATGGHLRVRLKKSQEPTVECFKGAVHLSKVH